MRPTFKHNVTSSLSSSTFLSFPHRYRQHLSNCSVRTSVSFLYKENTLSNYRFFSSNTIYTMPKVYAVRKGRKTGIFQSWNEVKQNVHNYSGAQFKSFKTEKEALDYLNFKPQQKVKQQEEKQHNDDDRKIHLETETETQQQQQKQNQENGLLEPPLPEGDVQVVYTDGACAGNGRLGAIAGIGVYFGDQDPRNVSEPLGEGRQTNQRAELQAALVAIKTADPDRELQIRTDSQYTLKCATEWIKKWKRNGFKTASGKDVENADLVKALDAATEERSAPVTWVHVAGHKGIWGNEIANDLAVAGAQKSLT